jgi:hypothetical protein
MSAAIPKGRKSSGKIPGGIPAKRRRGRKAIVRKIPLKDSDEEEFKHYAALTPKKRIEILLHLLRLQGIHSGPIVRTVKISQLRKKH